MTWSIEDLNVAGLMRGNTPMAQADAGMGDIKRQLVYKGQWRHTRGDPGIHVVPQQQDLQRMRHCEPEAEAGTNLDLPPAAGPGMTGT